MSDQRLQELRRDECERCGSDMDSLARPGECADDRCRGRMIVVRYVPLGMADTRLREAEARAEKAEHELRRFQGGLTDVLRVYNVPAMPSWSEAIHWLARHGGRET